MGIFNESIKTIKNSTNSIGGKGKKSKGSGGKKTPGAGILRNTKIRSGLK